jgi:hypothetical protein
MPAGVRLSINREKLLANRYSRFGFFLPVLFFGWHFESGDSFFD